MNLGRIQHLIDTGRIDSSKPITLKSLHDAGIQNLQDGVKILGGVILKDFSFSIYVYVLVFGVGKRVL